MGGEGGEVGKGEWVEKGGRVREWVVEGEGKRVGG